MAIDPIRGCGWRKVGGLYLCGSYVSVSCDRLPYVLATCPVCGGGIKVSRGFTRINPYRLFGSHQDCKDQSASCFMCQPRDDAAFIMGVGEKYYKTPDDFTREAWEVGVSKRIPFVPKELKLGETVIYLAHPKACKVREPVAMQQAMAILEEARTKQPRLLETEKVEKSLGIFNAFIPQRIEKLIWESQATPDELEKLEKRGIKPVIVPDGDRDHA